VVWLDWQSDINHQWRVIPFIDVALGSAFNTASGYSESPVSSSTPTEGAGFANHTATTLAWRLGVGMNYSLPTTHAHSFTVGVAYRYSDLGSAQTGAAGNYATATQGLKQHLNNSEWLFTARYNI
jgi:opacity protein-like surface antigen